MFFSSRMLRRKDQGIRDKEDRTGSSGGIHKLPLIPSKFTKRYTVFCTFAGGHGAVSGKLTHSGTKSAGP